MKGIRYIVFGSCLFCALLQASGSMSAQTLAPESLTVSDWQVVVNNGVVVPGDTRKFNSYNQPSINVNQLVVFRGRSKGGTSGEPAHGIFLRDMSIGGAITTLFDRNTLVPQPNDLDVMFTEPPSFPRIDMYSGTVASRGSHPPAWEYVIGTDPDTGEVTRTRVGTTGIYTNPFGSLITGASNMGTVPDFDFLGVRGQNGQTIKFDVFPGAPAVADKTMIVFKGNYTEQNPNDPTTTIGRTGVYYRTLTNAPIGPVGNQNEYLQPAGGSARVVKIADNYSKIPGGEILFGSTAPPSAVGYDAVFAGFDNENAPTKGGIYLAKLNSAQQPPPLTPLIQIGGPVPGEKRGVVFNRLGEGLSFDGRFVAFWGAWGTEVKNLVLQCPSDGNKNVIAYCKELYGGGELPGTASDDGFHTTVPLHQGIFVYDIRSKTAWAVAKTPDNFSDFVYWNFSGKVPPPQGGTDPDGGTDGVVTIAAEGGGSGTEGETDGEPARWRSASFVAVSGLVDGSLRDDHAHAIFKARTGTITAGAYVDPKDGLYLRPGPDSPVRFTTLVETGMEGTKFDPAATYIPIDEVTGEVGAPTVLPVTTMGIERDGFRGNTVVLNIGMGTEEAGWAGIYMTKITK